MGKFIENNVLNLVQSSYKENLKELIRYIYFNCLLDHDEMKKLYKNVKVPIKFDDNDEDFNDYYRQKLKFVTCNIKDNEYLYVYGTDKFDAEDFNNNPLVVEVHKYLQNNSPKKLKIGDFIALQLNNNNGIYKDVHGVRFMDWKLHFWEMYDCVNKSGITLHDLIIAAYKIKSHKFENWYEKFVDIKALYFYNDEVLRVQVIFNHGS